MLNGACHCGLVRIDVPDAPATLTLCNCSICRRNGALWAFYAREDVKMTGHPENTTGYVWGAKTITTYRCTGCGSVTHWEPLAQANGKNFGVNVRNFDPADIGAARLRRFDGADAWVYID